MPAENTAESANKKVKEKHVELAKTVINNRILETLIVTKHNQASGEIATHDVKTLAKMSSIEIAKVYGQRGSDKIKRATFKIKRSNDDLERKDKTASFLNTKTLNKDNFHKQAVIHKVQLANDGSLNLIVETNLRKTSSIAYYTTPEKITKLQNRGLTKSQAMTSQVIEAVGHYRTIIAKRRIDAHIDTNKTKAKKEIVKDVQRLVRGLQAIERCINQPTANLLAIALAYIDELNRLEKAFDIQGSETYKEHLAYDLNYVEKLKANLQKYRRMTEEFFGDKPTRPTITDSGLQKFLRTQINEILSDAKEQNEQLTLNSLDSTFRGKFHNCLCDADVVIRDYEFDQHNPITKVHQLDFSDNKEKVLYYSKEHLGNSREAIEDALYGISDIEELDKDIKASTVLSAGWNNFSYKISESSKLKPGASKLELFIKIIIAISFAPFILLAYLLANIANMLVRGFASSDFIETQVLDKLDNFFKSEKNKYIVDEQPDNKANFKNLTSRIGVNNLRFSSALGNVLHYVLEEIIAFPIQFPIVLYRLGKKYFSLIKKDLLEGKLYELLAKNKYNATNDTELKTEQSDSPRQSLSLEMKSELDQLNEKIKNVALAALQENGLIKFTDKKIIYAAPRFPLTPYKPDDVLTHITDGLVAFTNLFKDEVIQKHPVTGFIAGLIYIGSGAAVFTPAVLTMLLTKLGVKTVTPELIKCCNTLACYMSHGQSSEAVAAASTLSQAIAMPTNLVSQGADSWTAKLIEIIKNDPAAVVVGLGAAYALGTAISSSGIPVISAAAREEEGKWPWIASILMGGKLGLVALESVTSEDESHKSKLAIYLSGIVKYVFAWLRCLATVVTWNAEPWKDLVRSHAGIFASLFYNVNRLVVLASQVFKDVFKNFTEAAIMTLMFLGKMIVKPFIELAALLGFDVNRQSTGMGKVLEFKKWLYHGADTVARGIRDTDRAVFNALGKAKTEPTNTNASKENGDTQKMLALLSENSGKVSSAAKSETTEHTKGSNFFPTGSREEPRYTGDVTLVHLVNKL